MIKIVSLYAQYKDSPADELICDVFNFLISKIYNNLEEGFSISKQNFIPPDDNIILFKKNQRKIRLLQNILSYKCKYFNNDIVTRIFVNLRILILFVFWIFTVKNNKSLKKHYSDILKKADILYFAGGGIFQTSYVQFWLGIYAVLYFCKKYNKKVIFNAIGIEKPKIFIEQIIYKILLNNKCIVAITTRDDIDYLQSILKEPNKSSKILDPALWTKECYQVEPKKSEVIGIGVIRSKIFYDNGIEVTVDKVLQFYVNLVLELEKRGYKCQLFSNGNNADYKLGQDVLKYLGRDSSFLAPSPETAEKLVDTINQYKAIIAARLHATVIATSIGIPAVGIVWNPKNLGFKEALNLKWDFITFNKFNNVEYIIKQLEKSISIGINQYHLEIAKKHTLEIMNVISRRAL